MSSKVVMANKSSGPNGFSMAFFMAFFFRLVGAF